MLTASSASSGLVSFPKMPQCLFGSFILNGLIGGLRWIGRRTSTAWRSRHWYLWRATSWCAFQRGRGGQRGDFTEVRSTLRRRSTGRGVSSSSHCTTSAGATATKDMITGREQVALTLIHTNTTPSFLILMGVLIGCCHCLDLSLVGNLPNGYHTDGRRTTTTQRACKGTG